MLHRFVGGLDVGGADEGQAVGLEETSRQSGREWAVMGGDLVFELGSGAAGDAAGFGRAGDPEAEAPHGGERRAQATEQRDGGAVERGLDLGVERLAGRGDDDDGFGGPLAEFGDVAALADVAGEAAPGQRVLRVLEDEHDVGAWVGGDHLERLGFAAGADGGDRGAEIDWVDPVRAGQQVAQLGRGRFGEGGERDRSGSARSQASAASPPEMPAMAMAGWALGRAWWWRSFRVMR